MICKWIGEHRAITLTAGAEVVEGTAGDDTIEGVASSLTSARTLDAADQIDGGEGNDTLAISMQGSFTGFTGDGFLKNVETVELTNDTSIIRTFAAKQVEGVEKYVLNADMAAVNLTDLAVAGITVEVTNQQKGTISIGFADADDSFEDSAALALNLNTVGDEDNTVTIGGTNIAGIEELDVTVTGDTYVDLAGATGVETLTLAGDGNLEVADVAATVADVVATTSGTLDFTGNTGIETFDASGATGDVDVDLTAVTTAKQITSISTGTGDDTITVDTADLRANAEIDGGTGDDVLYLKGGLATAVQFGMSGVETLKLGALAGGLTFSAANVTGLETVQATKDIAADADLVGLGAADLTVQLQGINANLGSNTLSLDHSGATTLTVDTPSKDATTTVRDVNVFDVELANSSSLDLTIASKMEYKGSVTADKAESVQVAIAGTANTAEINAAVAASVVVSSVAQNSTLYLNTPDAVDMSVTASKNLTLTGGTTDLSGLESLTVSTAGTFTAGDLASVALLNLSGSGKVVVNDLGTSALDYAMTINAENLSKDLQINSIITDDSNITVNAAAVTGNVAVTTTIDAGAGDVFVDVTDVAKDVTIGGAITAANVTIEAANVVGDVSINAITATDEVTVNVSDILGDFTMGGKITADDVTVDASNALGTVTYEAFDIGNSITLIGTAYAANDWTVGSAKAITATDEEITVNVTGGIDNDRFAVVTADVNNTAKITVAGDLGLGTNGVLIDASAESDAGGVTIDASGLKNATVEIKGSAEDDTIKLSADSTETVTFAAAATNGEDTITGFTAGTGGDVLKLSALGTLVGTGADFAEDGVIGTAGNKIIHVTADAAADWSDVLTVMNAAIDTTGIVTGDVAILVSNGTDTNIYCYEDDLNVAAIEVAEITLVGVLKGVDADAGDFVASNFIA